MILAFFTWLLIFFRLGAFMTALPFFSSINVPVRVRLALAAMIAFFLIPVVSKPVDPAGLQFVSLILMIGHELAVGVFLGFVARLIFYCVQLAGHFISTEIGLQTSTLITPVDPVPVDVPGAVLNLLAMMLLLSLDVHHALIFAFRETYQALPIGGAGLSNALFDDLTLRVAHVFLLAVQIAAPLIAVSFLIALVMGMLGRAVPQMNVFFESFTIRLLAGLVVFGFAVNLAAQRISDFLRQVPRHVLESAQMLGGA